MVKYFVVFVIFVICGCTDADRAALKSFGNSGEVMCYSGGVLIYGGKSTGKIQATSQSDGWEFQDAKTKKFIRVSGDCVIAN